MPAHLQARVEKLERRLRMQDRAFMACVVLAVATSILIGQTPSQRTLEAERFVLRGPHGEELATLEGLGTGAALTLYDSKHRARIALTTHDDTEPAVVVFDSNLKGSASLGVNNSNPYVQLADGSALVRSDMAITAAGPAIRMWDSLSAIRVGIAIHNEVPLLTVSSGSDPRSGSVIMAADGKGGHVEITGPDGKARNVMR